LAASLGSSAQAVAEMRTDAAASAINARIDFSLYSIDH
jgi:hypothetical protein